MPMCAMCEPSGPIENGTTYIVRPRMLPRNRAWSPVCSSSRIARGSIQLLVGPAAAWVALQMKVRSSTRATSPGSLRARKLFGRLNGFSRSSVRAPISCSISASYSASEPSHQWIAAGSVRAAISATQASRRSCLTWAGAPSRGVS